MEIPPQHSIDIRPIEVPGSSRFMEVVIVVLMGVTVLGMAFLFYNQAVLLERINANQEMLRSITNQVRPTPRVALVPESTPNGYTPPQPAPAPAVAPAPTAVPPDTPAAQATPRLRLPRPTAPQPTVIAQTTPPAPSPPPATTPTPQPASPPPATPSVEKTPDPAPAPPSTASTTPATPAPESAEPNTESQLWGNYGPTILQTIEELYKGDYDSVTGRFTKQYALDLPKSKLAHIMDMDRSKYGSFKRVLGHQLDDRFKFEDRKIFKVTIDTDQNRIIVFTIALNSSKQIMSLYFQPVVLQEG